MDEDTFQELEPGDVVRHIDNGIGYIVHDNYLTGGVLIVRAQLIHNPHEWKLVEKHD